MVAYAAARCSACSLLALLSASFRAQNTKGIAYDCAGCATNGVYADVVESQASWHGVLRGYQATHLRLILAAFRRRLPMGVSVVEPTRSPLAPATTGSAHEESGGDAATGIGSNVADAVKGQVATK